MCLDYFFLQEKKRSLQFEKQWVIVLFAFLSVLTLIVFPSVSDRIGLKISFPNQFGGHESKALVTQLLFYQPSRCVTVFL